MAKQWTVKEDIILCKFVYENHGKYLDAEMQYSLIADLQEAGFEARSIVAINKRASAFQKLFWGIESPYATDRMKVICQSFLDLDETDYLERIRTQIKQTYNPNCIADGTIPEKPRTKLSSEGNIVDLTGYQCSVNFNETFPMVLQRFIDQKAIRKNKEIYDRIFMKADTFSAILRGKYSVVKKENVLRLCVGLQLSVNEAEEFMESAGYLFSRGIMTDVVVKTCLANQCYNPLVIDEELCEHNAPALFGIA